MTRAFRRRRAPSAPRIIAATSPVEPEAGDRIVVNGVLLTVDQTRRFRQARSRPAIAAIEAEIAAVASRAKAEADREETRTLEEARGEAVEVSGKAEHRGRLRIKTRDGLETLLTARSITIGEHAAGLRYRADFEHTDPERGLTPPAMDQTRRIVRGGDGWQGKLEEIKARLATLEAIIQSADPTYQGPLAVKPLHRIGRRVWTLRQIAGKGENLASLGLFGNSRYAALASLREALQEAAVAYGVE